MSFRESKWYGAIRLGAIIAVLLIFILFWKTTAVHAPKSGDENSRVGVATESARENKGIYLKEENNDEENLYVTLLSDTLPTGQVTDDIDMLLATMGSGKAIDVYYTSKNESISPYFEANASIEFKKKSKNEAQKSYKLRLFDKAGQWKGQSVINLNKYDNDPLRIRNKLTYDLFAAIPEIASVRTNFVHLYVRSAGDNPALGYRDYGLFVHTEQVNTDYLQARGFESTGNFYEVNNFNFYWNKDLKEKTDPEFSASHFNEMFDVKGNDDHSQLIEFVNAVNDQNGDINQVAERYLDMDNYFTWVATSILTGHYSGSSENYYLYRPSNSSKWSHIPWDYDGSWIEANTEYGFKKGLYIFWDNLLYKRLMSDEDNIKKLDQKIDEVYKILNKERTQELLTGYHKVVFDSITKLPDYKYIGMPIEVFEKDYFELAEIPEKNYTAFKESLKAPKPFLLKTASGTSGQMDFEWEGAHSPTKENVTYVLEVAKDPTFNEVVIKKEEITKTEIEIESVPIGKLFWRITAIDESGRAQGAMNILETPFGEKYYGISSFEVK